MAKKVLWRLTIFLQILIILFSLVLGSDGPGIGAFCSMVLWGLFWVLSGFTQKGEVEQKVDGWKIDYKKCSEWKKKFPLICPLPKEKIDDAESHIEVLPVRILQLVDEFNTQELLLMSYKNYSYKEALEETQRDFLSIGATIDSGIVYLFMKGLDEEGMKFLWVYLIYLVGLGRHLRKILEGQEEKK